MKRFLAVAIAVWGLAEPAAFAKSSASPPALPAPTGTVVNVSTEAQLQAAVSHLASNSTIVIAPGTYVLTNTLYFNGTFNNVAVRGATNNRDDVVLVGPGMANASYGSVPYGIWTGNGVNGILIANLTIRDLYYHPIIFNAGTQSPRVYNVHLINAGQQFVKSNPDSAGNGVNNGIVEYSVIEYTSTASSDYTNGVDIHAGVAWIIRHNLFRNIVSPPGLLAGPSVLVWNHARDTIVEGNSFVNCARGISFGLSDVAGTDHSGGIIRNNFFFRATGQPGDVAIAVYDSPNTQVLNNTIFVSGTYSSPIEYRYPQTTGIVIANNVTDGTISARDGATATLSTNLAGARAEWFVNAAAGDLHLAASATSAIDHGTTTAAVTDDWDGQLRPQGAAYDIGADERGATVAAFQIAGHVVDGNTGAPMAGVSVTLSGARSQTAMTGAAGDFSFTDLAGSADYTVTPAKASVTISPANRSYSNLSASQMATDFKGFTAVAKTPPGRASGDFDGDRKADIAIFRPSNGIWFVMNSATGTATGVQWGNGNDVPVPGDYDGDGKSDVAVFRPSTGTWFIVRSSTGAATSMQWGNGNDVPVPGDYDGDGKMDIAVFRPSTGTWLIVNSSTGAPVGVQWGNGLDVPVPGDYDGDGKTDIATFRPSTGTWFIVNSSGSAVGIQWGNGNDVVVPGDYDGDGKTDIAVFRPSSGTWFIVKSHTGAAVGVQWGNELDVPVPNDYDGDGKTDIAVFRPSIGTWFIIYSGTGAAAGIQWGNASDIPILKRP